MNSAAPHDEDPSTWLKGAVDGQDIRRVVDARGDAWINRDDLIHIVAPLFDVIMWKRSPEPESRVLAAQEKARMDRILDRIVEYVEGRDHNETTQTFDGGGPDVRTPQDAE